MTKNKKIASFAVISIVLLSSILGIVIVQKSLLNKSVPTKVASVRQARIVDLKSQPEWVQKLEVKAVKGLRKGVRGLDNVTIIVQGMPQGLVSSLTYTMSYPYQGSQSEATGGFFTDTPVKIEGKTDFRKTFDFGTCSTKSCVRHDGVTKMEIEIDFVTNDDEEPVWSNTVEVSP